MVQNRVSKFCEVQGALVGRPRTGERAWACHHPDRKNWAHGLCSTCYQKHRRRENPEYRAKHLHTNWKSRLKSNFGLTPEQYQDMERNQNHVCKICGKQEKTKRLAIDHNWHTGKIRGLLCLQCNTHLGWLEKFRNEIEGYLL